MGKRFVIERQTTVRREADGCLQAVTIILTLGIGGPLVIVAVVAVLRGIVQW